MNERDLENFYREHLEEDIIFYLSEHLHISLEKAMHMYYMSELSERIYQGEGDIQYLSYRLLAQMVEKELLDK